MTKQEILKIHKMTEKEFYEKFPTQEAYNQFQMGGSLSPKQKFQDGGLTPLVATYPTQNLPATGTNVSTAAAAPAAAPGGFKLSNLPGLGGGQQAPKQTGEDPNAPTQKNIGKTIGAVGGAAIGSLIPGAGTMIGGVVGGAIGGAIDKKTYENKMEDYSAVKSSQQNAMTSNIAGNFNPSAQGKQFKMGGNFTEYHGNTHENGGIPIGQSEVEGGETNNNGYIYSDTLKLGKKTFADMSKKINNKYSRRPDDKISMESKERELGNLMKVQESTGMTNNSRGMFQDGGKFNPNNPMSDDRATLVSGNFDNFGAGKPFDTNTKNEEQIFNRLPIKGVASMTTPSSTPSIAGNVQEIPSLKPTLPLITYNGNMLPNNKISTPGSFGYDTPKQEPGSFNIKPPTADLKASKFIGETRGKNNYNPVSPVDTNKPLQTSVNPLGYLASAIGPAYNIAQGLRGGDPVNFDRMTSKYQYADPKGAMAAASRGVTSAYNSAKNAARNTATSAGEYLANMGNLASKEGMDRAASLAGIKSQYDIANTQGLNQTNLTKDQFNAQVQMRESEARQQEQDAARSSISQGLNNFGQNTLGYGQDRAMNKTQNTMLPLLADGYEYVMDADGKVSTRRKISNTNKGNQITEVPK
jgi:hypothetical protein